MFSLVAQMVKNLPAVWETWVWSLGWEGPLEDRMVTHSSILAWGIPWTQEPVHGIAKSDTTEWLIRSLSSKSLNKNFSYAVLMLTKNRMSLAGERGTSSPLPLHLLPLGADCLPDICMWPLLSLPFLQSSAVVFKCWWTWEIPSGSSRSQSCLPRTVGEFCDFSGVILRCVISAMSIHFKTHCKSWLLKRWKRILKVNTAQLEEACVIPLVSSKENGLPHSIHWAASGPQGSCFPIFQGIIQYPGLRELKMWVGLYNQWEDSHF